MRLDGMPPRTLAYLLTIVVLVATAELARADDAIWNKVREGGYALLLRHANAPGTGDPPGFALRDCATQRNLDDRGREQARRIGAKIRESGIRVTRVLSSRWCRASETADLLDVGRAEPAPFLDSFFAGRGSEENQTAAFRQAVASLGADEIVLFVTHQVNITALTGEVPRSGEMVVLKAGPAGSQTIGRIAF
jgi:phosphohistidine phosphatase SixA